MHLLEIDPKVLDFPCELPERILQLVWLEVRAEGGVGRHPHEGRLVEQLRDGWYVELIYHLQFNDSVTQASIQQGFMIVLDGNNQGHK